MTSQLEIAETQLAVQRTVKPGCEDAPCVEIKLTVANHDAKKERHLISSIRGTTYDATTKTLTVWLAEPERSLIPAHLSPVRQVRLGPGETQVLQLLVPLKYRLAHKQADGHLEFEEVDLSSVKHVSVHVAHADAPFAPDPAERSDHRHTRLRSWGKEVQKTFDRSLSAQ